MSASDSRLPLIVAYFLAVAMVTALLWQGYRIWQSHSGPGSVASTIVQAEQPARTGTDPSADVDLAAIDLFGRNDGSNPSETVDTENLPETNLRLTLRGVLAAEGDFPGSALIEDNDKHTEAYLVGSTLPGNAVLNTVRADRVVIERNGTLENLRFPEDEKTSEFLMAENAEAEPAETDQQNGSATQDSEDSGIELQRQQDVQDRLERVRERLRSNNN